MNIETLAIHAVPVSGDAGEPVVEPLILSTTFRRDPAPEPSGGYLYSRVANPNRDAFERCMAALEGGTDAAAFASGTAVTATLLQTLHPGDHVIFPTDAYFGTAKTVEEVALPWGLQATFCDTADPGALSLAVTPATRLIWIETPSNPTLRVTDIALAVHTARQASALLVCDNTWPTPVLTRPLELGADLVVHSSTKYLGGHGDVMGGVVVSGASLAAQECFRRIRTLQSAAGAVPSPFDCWLLSRGLKTLALRVRAQSESAARIAAYLAEHPAVEAVHYPGLPSSPGHEAAARQMSSFGGMLSFQVRGGRDASLEVASRCRLFTHATSLGGVESLIEHRASVEKYATSTPDNLLRVSVGLENPADLIEDLRQALEG